MTHASIRTYVRTSVRKISRFSRSTSYIPYSIELNVSMMIRDISLENRMEPDSSVSPQAALWGRASWKLQIYSQPKVFIRFNR